ncbi:MAG TPA: outer membrane protein assembly factor BamE [Candidatus Acidoferrales bacterium]|nr:outer membrane protein assembly factor BamE [Candidatus Acidoferrales bacterium]
MAKMSGKIAGLLCAAALFLSGCVTIGRDFSTAPVTSIKQNVTTQREIFSYFGEPYKKGWEDGYETWSYLYNYWELGQLRESKELTVVFNKDNTVRTYSFNSK